MIYLGKVLEIVLAMQPKKIAFGRFLLGWTGVGGEFLYNICIYIHTTGMRNFHISRSFLQTNAISRFFFFR